MSKPKYEITKYPATVLCVLFYWSQHAQYFQTLKKGNLRPICTTESVLHSWIKMVDVPLKNGTDALLHVQCLTVSVKYCFGVGKSSTSCPVYTILPLLVCVLPFHQT